MSGDVVSIHSRDEEEVLRPFLQYVQWSIYIGLTRSLPHGGTFAWSDGSPLDYENWNHNEPNGMHERCVEAIPHDVMADRKMGWNDITCEHKKAYVCKIKKILSATEDSPGNKPSDEYVPCDRGWYYFRNKCYKSVGRKLSERLSWDRALARCKSWGADLVSIHSQEEQEFVVSFPLLDIQYFAWIGLNDREKEEDYKWTDGSNFQYSDWAEDEPKGSRKGFENEDCVHLVVPWKHPLGYSVGKWNDRDCDVKDGYICEKNEDNRKKSPNPMYCSPEAGGGWKYQTSCYHVVAEKKSWEDAEKYCKRNYHGHLVTIRDKLEDAFLDYVLKNMSNGVWIGIKIQEQLQQKWNSGWYVSYNGFSKEELHFLQGTCVARKTRKKWIMIPCSRKISFICEVNEERPPVLKFPPKGAYCPKDSYELRDLGGEYCYYIETTKGLNFYEASFDCRRRGGDIVSIHSRDEEEVLRPFLQYVQWSIYIGLIRSLPHEETFTWYDGSPLDYENWNHNEPNGMHERCVEAIPHDVMAGRKMGWNDISCEHKKAYVCKIKKITPRNETDSCAGFCIPPTSYLYGVISQCTEAKSLQ